MSLQSKILSHKSEKEQLVDEVARLKKLFVLHNLLPFIAKAICRCDPDVGAVPCEGCAASEILKKAGSE